MEMQIQSRNGKLFTDLEVNKKIIEWDGIKKNAFDALDKFTDLIKGKLDMQNWYAPIAYTPHDYTHHVIHVLQYGSKILKPALDQFTMDDLLVFQYACLLHDIDMMYNPKARQKHSMDADLALNPYSDEKIKEEAVTQIKTLYNTIKDSDQIEEVDKNIQDTLTGQVHQYLNTVLTFLLSDQGDYWEPIGQVILGHSDIKLSKTRINTLDKGFYDSENIGAQSQENIKTRVLAAVLRLADELDCSQQRKNGIEKPILDSLPSEAKDYWKKLDLIKQVKIDLPKIELQVNTSFIRKDTDKEDCYRLLKEVHDKISQEFALVKGCINDAKININIEKPEPTFDNSDIEKEYKEYVTIEKKKEGGNDTHNALTNVGHIANDVDVEHLRKCIQDTIKEKNLMCSVHRRIQDRGMRNHLDCNGLLADEEILDKVTKAFVNYIYTHTFDKSPEKITQDQYYLVGIANSGVLLASRVSMITGLPMMYFIPSQKAKNFSEKENAWAEYANYYKGRKPILIIGVNVTGESIKNAKSFLKRIMKEKEVDIEAVIGIVNRDVDGKNDSGKIFDSLKKKNTHVAFLLTDYAVDWCQYSLGTKTCPYNDICDIERKKEDKDL